MDWIERMDWAGVIDRHRTMLLNIVATLFAMAGLDFEQGGLSGHNSGKVTLPRWVYRSIMLVLRPAESALRRLVIIAARGLTVEPPRIRPPRPAKPKPVMVVWLGRQMPYPKVAALVAAGITSLISGQGAANANSSPLISRRASGSSTTTAGRRP